MWGRRVLPTALPALFSTTLSPALLVYLCANVGPQGLLVVRLAAPFIPHSTSLGPATATRVLSALVPVSAPPTGLDDCLFFYFLGVDFLAVRFSVSSGCARRCSVSTYAAILVLLHLFILIVFHYLFILSMSCFFLKPIKYTSFYIFFNFIFIVYTIIDVPIPIPFAHLHPASTPPSYLAAVSLFYVSKLLSLFRSFVYCVH